MDKLNNASYERCCIQGDVTRGQRSHGDAHEGAIRVVIVGQGMTEWKGDDDEFRPVLGQQIQGWRMSSVKQSVLKGRYAWERYGKGDQYMPALVDCELYQGSLETSRAAARSGSGLLMTLPCISDGYSYEW